MTQPDTTHISETDLRQLEASTMARFHAVNARFLLTDGRFATLGDRLNDLGQDLATLDRSTAARCKDLDRAVDQALAQLNQVEADIAADIERMYSDLRRIVILGLLGTVLTTATLCLATLVLVL